MLICSQHFFKFGANASQPQHPTIKIVAPTLETCQLLTNGQITAPHIGNAHMTLRVRQNGPYLESKYIYLFERR